MTETLRSQNGSSYLTKNSNTAKMSEMNFNSTSQSATRLLTISEFGFSRSVFLFLLGLFVSFVLHLLHVVNTDKLSENFLPFIFSIWFYLIVCGGASVYVGFWYSYFDRKVTKSLPYLTNSDWSLTFRCIIFFIGLNHLCAKIHFSSSMQFLFTFCCACLIFWYMFDYTKFGVVFNLINAVFVTVVAYFLRRFEMLSVSDDKFSYLQTCLFCLTFSGGITIGSIERLLDYNRATQLQTSPFVNERPPLQREETQH